MAINVKCVITIDESKYEAGSKDMQIIEVYGKSSTTGLFSGLPKELLSNMVSSSVERAVNDAVNKLNVIKGE